MEGLGRGMGGERHGILGCKRKGACRGGGRLQWGFLRETGDDGRWEFEALDRFSGELAREIGRVPPLEEFKGEYGCWEKNPQAGE